MQKINLGIVVMLTRILLLTSSADAGLNVAIITITRVAIVNEVMLFTCYAFYFKNYELAL